jgi:hypothetical protein
MDTCGTIFTQPFYSGDDIPIAIQFYQSDKVTPKPMTGFNVGMTVKAALDDGYGNLIPDSQALFQKDLPGDNTGLFTFKIPALNAQNAATLLPGNYYLDVKQWDTTSKRTTVLSTMLPINESVTLRPVP